MVKLNGREFDIETVAHYMDQDIREDLHGDGYDDEQEFVDAYCEAHKVKHGEDFVVN